MKPAPAALAWAEQQRFSTLASVETIIAAYEAHLRILAKIAARKAAQ
jgi:2-methylcitrate dehydratase PrpD